MYIQTGEMSKEKGTGYYKGTTHQIKNPDHTSHFTSNPPDSNLTNDG